jgi:hypothetical protein
VTCKAGTTLQMLSDELDKEGLGTANENQMNNVLASLHSEFVVDSDHFRKLQHFRIWDQSWSRQWPGRSARQRTAPGLITGTIDYIANNRILPILTSILLLISLFWRLVAQFCIFVSCHVIVMQVAE